MGLAEVIMEEELARYIKQAVEINSSGRCDSLNQKICLLADNHNGHENWQVKVLADLCFRNFSEYRALNKAYEAQADSEPSLLAWRARNLLEISVWSSYCARSKENARVFYEDAGRDAVDLCKVLSEWGKATSQENDWLDPIEEAKLEISQRATAEGIGSLDGPYKQVRKAASACGFGDHFNVHNKLLSKYAHPTAMLVVASLDQEKQILLKDMFYSFGCMYFVGAFTPLERVLTALVECPV
ncbi:MAG: hypothetical protein HQL43_14265 [Alphaproteobacteria bacterium]|nr:hypothetical protein [Alphaproteobacteria bacterium]